MRVSSRCILLPVSARPTYGSRGTRQSYVIRRGPRSQRFDLAATSVAALGMRSPSAELRGLYVKQIVRRVIDRRGTVAVIDLPAPHMGPNQVLIQNAYSLISSGTEMSTLSKTPTELVRQTLSDPWMRHVVKHT